MNHNVRPPPKVVKLLQGEIIADDATLKAAAIEFERFLGKSKIEGKIEELLEEKKELFNKAEEVSFQNGKLESAKDEESSNAHISSFILGLRSTIDEIMESNFSKWILNSGLNLVNQWKLMFRNKDNPFVQIFVKRLDSFQKEYEFKKTYISEGKSTETIFSTLKIDKPNLL